MTSAEKLMEKGIRPSLTRVMIYDYLLSHRTHPTVDEIYKELSPKAPTLSKTTVYNTVKLFEENSDILEYYQNLFKYIIRKNLILKLIHRRIGLQYLHLANFILRKHL